MLTRNIVTISLVLTLWSIAEGGLLTRLTCKATDDQMTIKKTCTCLQNNGIEVADISRSRHKHRSSKHAITISANITLSEENFLYLKNLHHFSIRNLTNQFFHGRVSLARPHPPDYRRHELTADPRLDEPPKQARYYIYSVRPATKEERSDNDELIRIRYQKLVDPKQVNSTDSTVRSRRARTAIDDVVSKNISMVLENLLKSYENSQLPTHGQGIPTLVRTNILIRSMGPISELDMDYAMDCYFRQYWRDTRLSFQSPIKSLSLSIKMLEKIWRPDTYFYNGKHSHVHTITVPNKLLRLSQDGDILYSMRLTIKASCPMELKNFPMDRQSCPLILGSYAYSTEQLAYEWQSDDAVGFVPGMTLSQFDLVSFSQRNFTLTRREGDFSALQVSFNLQRHTGYFLIQIYVPCILIVVLSWVSFWIHREATSDRVGLGITTVLTLSTISLDSRKDLPKVRYATSLDWFLLMCFFYCIATLLEFAFVHYFTKVGSGEIPVNEDEWEDIDDPIVEIGGPPTPMTSRSVAGSKHDSPTTMMARRRSSLICPIYNDPAMMFRPASSCSTMERTTQTEPPKASKWKHLWLCFLGDEKFRRQRQREATEAAGDKRHVNSVSLVDRSARVMFPASFLALNILYWLIYYTFQDDFPFPRFHGI